MQDSEHRRRPERIRQARDHRRRERGPERRSPTLQPPFIEQEPRQDGTEHQAIAPRDQQVAEHPLRPQHGRQDEQRDRHQGQEASPAQPDQQRPDQVKLLLNSKRPGVLQVQGKRRDHAVPVALDGLRVREIIRQCVARLRPRQERVDQEEIGREDQVINRPDPQAAAGVEDAKVPLAMAGAEQDGRDQIARKDEEQVDGRAQDGEFTLESQVEQDDHERGDPSHAHRTRGCDAFGWASLPAGRFAIVIIDREAIGNRGIFASRSGFRLVQCHDRPSRLPGGELPQPSLSRSVR